MARVGEMADESGFGQGVFDAIALATLMAEAGVDEPDWSEALTFARARLQEQGENLVMAEAYLLVQSLRTLRDVLNGLSDDVKVDGIERPVTLLALLEQFGASAAGSQD